MYAYAFSQSLQTWDASQVVHCTDFGESASQWICDYNQGLPTPPLSASLKAKGCYICTSLPLFFSFIFSSSHIWATLRAGPGGGRCCTNNSDCPGSTPYCSGSPGYCMACLNNGQCSGGTPYCLSGTCSSTQCLSASQCVPPQICTCGICYLPV